MIAITDRSAARSRTTRACRSSRPRASASPTTATVPTNSCATSARIGCEAISANGPSPCRVNTIAMVAVSRPCKITKVVRSRRPAQIVTGISVNASGPPWVRPKTRQYATADTTITARYSTRHARGRPDRRAESRRIRRNATPTSRMLTVLRASQTSADSAE